jgi:hypothetical protein
MTQTKFPFPTTAMYVTTTWVSDGIIEIEPDKITSENHNGFFGGMYVSYINNAHTHRGFERIGAGIFYTKEEAIACVEKKREKRIAALKKQMKKLENMKFD